MAIFGWDTLKEAERYTRGADRLRVAPPCTCSKQQNKTAQIRVPPKTLVGLFQEKAERNQTRFLMMVPRGGVSLVCSYKDLQ